jgi:hypothetical protein
MLKPRLLSVNTSNHPETSEKEDTRGKEEL